MWERGIFNQLKVYWIQQTFFITVQCEALDPPSSGSVSVESTGSYTRATYNCVTGYDIEGVTQRSCLTNGTWDLSAPTCGKFHNSVLSGLCMTLIHKVTNTILQFPVNAEVKMSENCTLFLYIWLSFSLPIIWCGCSFNVHWTDIYQTSQECSFGCPISNCAKN